MRMPDSIILGLQGIDALLIYGSAWMTAYAVSARLFSDAQDVAIRWISSIVLWAWLLVVIFFSLAGTGWFFPLPATAFLLFLTGLSLRGKGTVVIDRLYLDLKATATALRPMASFPEAGLYLVGAAALALSIVRGALTPPLAWDSLTYHLVYAGTWVQTGSLFPTIHAPDYWDFCYAHYPLTGEIFSAWAMLPFHGDLLANMAHLPFWLLNFIVVGTLGVALGLSTRRSALAALIAAFNPAMFAYLTSGYVDPAATAMQTAGCLFTLRAFQQPSKADLLLAAASFGVALGVKLPTLNSFMLMSPLLIFAWWKLPTGERASVAFRMVLAIGAVSAPWYLRNWIVADSFTYPLEFRIGPWLLSPGSPEYAAIQVSWGAAWDRIHTTLTPALWSNLGIFHPFSESFSRSTGPALLITMLLAPFGLRHLWKPGQRVFLALLFVVSLVFVIGFYSPTMRPIRMIWADSMCRFLHFSFQVFLLLSMALVRRQGLGKLLAGTLAATFVIDVFFRLPENWSIGMPLIELAANRGVWLALGILPLMRYCSVGTVSAEPPGLPAVPTESRPEPFRSFKRTAFGAIGIALLFAVALTPLTLIRSAYRPWFFTNGHDLAKITNRPDAAWNWAESASQPLHIACSAGWDGRGHNWFWYPLLGGQLQNRLSYISITADGFPPNTSVFGPPKERADRAAWLGRLIRHRIDSIVFFRPFPPEEAWTKELSAAFPVILSNAECQILRFDPSRLPDPLKKMPD